MIRDITIGQYYPADSPLHKLDPRTKLMGTLVLLFLCSCSIRFWGMQWQQYFWLL